GRGGGGGGVLANPYRRRYGIVHVALILELAGIVVTEEVVVGVEKRRLRAERHRVELAVEARRDVRAVLLGVELRVDADIFEVLHDELAVVDDDRRAVRGPAYARGEAVRITRRGEQTLGTARIIREVLRALAELIDEQRPFLERGGDARGVGDAHALVKRVDEPLAIERHRHGLS